MKREIKFRAWDKENEEMYDVAMIDVETGEVAYTDHPTGYNADALLEQVELMQYTGLKDKNGREIYEGDIVLVNRYDVLSTSWNSEIENEKKILIMSRVGYVVYDELRLSFRVKSPIGNQTIALSGVGYFDYDIEVIGNIYENKKLLDVK